MIDENQKSISREIQIPWLNRILTRVLFLAMAISLLPLLLVGTATVYFVGQDAEQKAENALLVSTADLARQVENYFVLLTEDIKFIAGHFDRENLLSKDNIRFLSAFAATHHDIQIIWAANNAGEYSILYSRAEMLKKTTSTLDIQPLPGQDDIKIVWHDTRYDTFGESIITGSIPIMSPWEDRSSGLLVFEIRPQSLHGLFESIDIGGKGIAMLIDESGQLVSHSNRGVVTTGQDMASHPEIEQLQNEHSDDSKPRMCSFLRVNGKNILSTYQKIEPIEWGVIVERDESEVYRTRNRLIRLVAGCFFALLLLLIPLAILFSWRLTSPLAKLLNTIKEQASGNQAARSNVAIPDEIGVLATTFNQMMSTIHKHTTELKQEITFRKKVEESLRASQVFNETLLNTSPDIIYIYDINERKNVYSNQGIMNILGYSIEEVKAMGERFIANLMHPDDFKVYLNETIPRYQTAKDGELIEHEYRMSHKNGTWCWLQSKESIFLRQDDGTPKQIFGMIGDITERKQAEEELEKHREHLEKLVEKRTEELKEKTDKIEESRKALTYLVEDVNESRANLEKANRDLGAVNKELQDFAYIVSHDLKAPLRAVSQLAYWIFQDYAEVLDEDGKEHLNLLRGRVKRMDGLINGILEYSRLGRDEEKQDKIDLNKTLSSVIEVLSPPENIRITIEDELPEIVGNSTHMEQVFQNLLDNAIKFMNKPEGLITIGCRDEESHWEFRINDNGPGIEEKYYQRIFKIFQTLLARDEHESTGIGLTLVKKTIEQYGGKVWVESEVGKGSSFVFTLPKK